METDHINMESIIVLISKEFLVAAGREGRASTEEKKEKTGRASCGGTVASPRLSSAFPIECLGFKLSSYFSIVDVMSKGKKEIKHCKNQPDFYTNEVSRGQWF